MKKNEQNINNNADNQLKKGFFKKIWYSIDKIEKYSELSAEGFGQAIKYIVILLIILSLISAGIIVYRTNQQIVKVSQYIKDEAPEFTYNNEILKVDSNEQPIIKEDERLGKVIIDTNLEDEQSINQYINNAEDDIIIILKDRLILKEVGAQSAVNYNYKDLIQGTNITEFNKQTLTEYLTSSNMIPLYLNLLMVLFIYALAIQLINTLLYAIMISIFGYLTTIILRLKIRYVAVLNMAIYSLTLPILLNMVYAIVEGIFNYTVNYFEVMYVLIASIYMIAAIFILKAEFNKKQGEVQKIIEVEKEIKENMETEKNEQKEKESKKDNKKTNKEDNQTEQGEAPEGSNA